MSTETQEKDQKKLCLKLNAWARTGSSIQQLIESIPQLRIQPDLLLCLNQFACKHGSGPIHQASENGNSTAIKQSFEFIDAKDSTIIPSLLNSRDIHYKTPLMYAAGAGKFNALKCLLQWSANPNMVKPNGWTALMYAANNGSLECVKFLLDHGANIHTINQEGATSLYIAARQGHTSVVQYLAHRDKELLDQCTLVSKRTPLHAASAANHVSTVQTLLELGANPCIRDASGLTGHHEAAQVNSIAITQLFESYGQVLATCETDVSGKHPLDYAILNMSTEYILFAIERMKNEPQSHQALSNALYTAAGKGNQDAVVELIKVGVDVNVSNSRRSALHIATLGGTKAHVEIVKCLLQAGANTNVHDASNKTPLEAGYAQLELFKQSKAAYPQDIRQIDSQTRSDWILAACTMLQANDCELNEQGTSRWPSNE